MTRVETIAPATIRKMSRDRKKMYLKISGLFLTGLGEIASMDFLERGGGLTIEGGGVLVFLSRDDTGVGGLAVNGGNKDSDGLIKGRGFGVEDKGGLDNGELMIGEGEIGSTGLGGGEGGVIFSTGVGGGGEMGSVGLEEELGVVGSDTEGAGGGGEGGVTGFGGSGGEDGLSVFDEYLFKTD